MASYFVDICLMFASLIQLKIINFFGVLMVNLNYCKFIVLVSVLVFFCADFL